MLLASCDNINEKGKRIRSDTARSISDLLNASRWFKKKESRFGNHCKVRESFSRKDRRSLDYGFCIHLERRQSFEQLVAILVLVFECVIIYTEKASSDDDNTKNTDHTWLDRVPSVQPINK